MNNTLSKIIKEELDKLFINESISNTTHQNFIAGIMCVIMEYIYENNLNLYVIQDGKIQETDNSLRCNILVKRLSNDKIVLGIEVCAASEVNANYEKLRELKKDMPNVSFGVYNYENNKLLTIG